MGRADCRDVCGRYLGEPPRPSKRRGPFHRLDWAHTNRQPHHRHDLSIENGPCLDGHQQGPNHPELGVRKLGWLRLILQGPLPPLPRISAEGLMALVTYRPTATGRADRAETLRPALQTGPGKLAGAFFCRCACCRMSHTLGLH